MTAVTIIRIGRPQVRNAIDSTTAQRLHREFANFEADPDAVSTAMARHGGYASSRRTSGASIRIHRCRS
jgi:enoyl-CoA hydratase/carnithine racemase